MYKIITKSHIFIINLYFQIPVNIIDYHIKQVLFIVQGNPLIFLYDTKTFSISPLTTRLLSLRICTQKIKKPNLILKFTKTD